MNTLRIIFLSIGLLTLIGCSPVKTSSINQYQLSAYSSKQRISHIGRLTLKVSPPEAVAGYQTQQMLYIKKPYQVESFAKNSWTNPVADMLYPLLVQSLQKTHYFYAVSSGSFNEETDYRLDTQVLSMSQNFLKKPSVLEFSAKIVLTHTSSNQVVGSKIISLQIPCPSDTPYGGVVAANRATLQFTAEVTDFVLSRVKQS
ncbi:MAG: ABC-type transport auxiliary lipoprotein family protein [Legionellales bacterium]